MAVAAELAADLAGEARRMGDVLDGAPAEEILGWALERYAPNVAVASSMAESVLVDMAARARPGTPVVFLDTGYHFAETLGTRDAVAARYDVTLLTVTPRQTVAEQDTECGPRLYERDPDACCARRKVEPLDRVLAPYVAWVTGIRRAETDSRRGVRVVDWDERRRMVKVAPLAAWTYDDVARYAELHEAIVNPLLGAGYDSVGCVPCTRPAAGRSGRWPGSTKTECGLHL